LVGVSAIKKSKFLFEKRRIKLTISSGIIFLILATGVDVILPQLNYYSIPPFGSLTAFILAGSIIYGITKYRMMTITPAYAASDIISTMSDSLILISPEGRIIEVNNAALSLLGYSREEIAGGPAMILFPEGTRHFLFNKEVSLLNKESFDKHQIFLRTKKGEDIPVSFSVSIMKDNEGNLLGIVGVARDIREIITLHKREKELAVEKIRSDIFQERAWELQEAYNKLKTTQSQLIRSEEKALFGQMAGDVANELNNVMGIILGFAQSVLQRIKRDDLFYLPLKSIEHEVLRCIKLVKDLLIFSSIEKKKWEEIDINRTIEETLSFIEIRTKMNNIDIVKDYGLELPRIIVNENQIKKVIVNLVNNAIDAMPDGGKVKLSTKIVGDWILIEVSDNGKGMTEKVKKHLFEPFFTTKKDSEGAGLGLSLSYEIIHNHNGLIEVESEIDKGSVFIVKLPVLKN
jgi:PAS domain S-box-containing protein